MRSGLARPGLRESLRASPRPDRVYTAFAGNDTEAVAEIRSRLVGIPPSSPCFALFRDGELVGVIERHEIQGASGEQVGEMLARMFAAGSPSG